MYLAYSVCSGLNKITALDAKLIVDGHEVISQELIVKLFQDYLPSIWTKTVAIFGKNESIFEMKYRFSKLEIPSDINQKLINYINEFSNNSALLKKLIKKIIKFDQKFIEQLKFLIISMHILFEKETIDQRAGKQMVHTLKTIADKIHQYYFKSNNLNGEEKRQ
jgi:hypothetical protein